MVAITVILAAVIGAFVLEIGDQQETAPNTSFSSDESIYSVGMGMGMTPFLNSSRVQLSHAGGDVLDISQTSVKVDGNESVFGLHVEPSGDQWAVAGPAPNVYPTLGTNQQTGFKSGQSMDVMWYCDPGQACGTARDRYPEFAPPPVSRIDSTHNADHLFVIPGQGSFSGATYLTDWYGYVHDSTKTLCPGGNRDSCALDDLETDDEIRVTWTAESGGKTQTLFKYTVQDGGQDETNVPPGY
jgi:hypothetical protein